MVIPPERFARAPSSDPRIETCWALVGPSRRILTCGIYRTDVGMEVRVGYNEHSLYALRTAELKVARAVAVCLRDAVNAADVFQEPEVR